MGAREVIIQTAIIHTTIFLRNNSLLILRLNKRLNLASRYMPAKSVTVEKRTKNARTSNCVCFIASKLKKAKGETRMYFANYPF